jgi:predicted LPLAT superfamily acyltransferase
MSAISGPLGLLFKLNVSGLAVSVRINSHALNGKRYVSYWKIIRPLTHHAMQRVAADHLHSYASAINDRTALVHRPFSGFLSLHIGW